MTEGFQCATCGAWHNDVPMSYGADAPYWYDVVAPEERSWRTELTSDQCVIDEAHFFIRGVLEIPIVDGDGPFTWGVWVSLSEAKFLRASELWETPGRESEPPYFGWLATEVPGYPSTLNLAARVTTRPVGQRPLIALEPTDHPLAVDQQWGIMMARVRDYAEQLDHEDGG